MTGVARCVTRERWVCLCASLSRSGAAIALLFMAGIASGCHQSQVPLLPPGEREASLPATGATARNRPEDAAAYRDRALALVDQRRWEEARAVLQEALRLNPDDAELINSLGWVEMEVGDVADAVPLFRRVIVLHPAISAAHYNLAGALVRLRRAEEADSVYRSILETDPDAAAAHGGLAWILFNAGRLDEAENEFREAVRLDPEHPWNHRGLAMLLMQQERFSDALPSFRIAARLTPNDARVWFDIGRVAHVIGSYAESAAAFDRVEKLDPNLLASSSMAKAMWEASKREEPYVPSVQ